jgi:hypothetical protein
MLFWTGYRVDSDEIRGASAQVTAWRYASHYRSASCCI